MASSIAVPCFQFSSKLPASYPGLLIASVVPFFVPLLLLSLPFLLLLLIPLSLVLIFLLGLKLFPRSDLPLIGSGKQDSSNVNRLPTSLQQHVVDRAPGLDERPSSSPASSSLSETRGGGKEEDEEEVSSRKKNLDYMIRGSLIQVDDIKAEQPAGGDQSILEENYKYRSTLPPAGDQKVLHREITADGESIEEESLHASGMEDSQEQSRRELLSIEAQKLDKIISPNMEEKLQLPVLTRGTVEPLEEERQTLYMQGTQFEPVVQEDAHSSAGLGTSTAINPACSGLAMLSSNAESMESLDVITTSTRSGQIINEAGQVKEVLGTSPQTSNAALSIHPPNKLEILAESESADYSLDAGGLPGQSISSLQIGSYKKEASGFLAGKASWIEASNPEQEHGSLAETETSKKYFMFGSGESLDKHAGKVQDIQAIEQPQVQPSTGELEEGRIASTDSEKSHFDFIGKQVVLENVAEGDELSALISTCKDNVESLVSTCVADECIDKQGHTEFPYRDLPSITEAEPVIEVVSMDKLLTEDPSRERDREISLVAEDLDVFKTTLRDNVESLVNTFVGDEHINKQVHAEFPDRDLPSGSEIETVAKVVSMDAPQMEDPSKEKHRETSLVAEDGHDHGRFDSCKTMESVQELSFHPTEVTDSSHISGVAGSKEHDIQSLSVRAVEEGLEAQEKPEIWQIDDGRSQSVSKLEQSSTDHEKSTEFPPRDLSSVTETEAVTKVVSKNEAQMEDPSKERDRETSLVAEDTHDHGHSEVHKTTLNDNVENLVDTCVADEYINKQRHTEFPLRGLSSIAETETVTNVVSINEPQIEDLSKETHRETSLIEEGTHDHGHLDVCKAMESIQELSSLQTEEVDFSHISSESGEKEHDDVQSLSVRAVEEVLEAQEKPEILQIDRRSQSVDERELSHGDLEKSTEFPARRLSSRTETDTDTQIICMDEPQLEDPLQERDRETFLVAEGAHKPGHLDVYKITLKDNIESPTVGTCVANEYINKQGHAEFPHRELSSIAGIETVSNVYIDEPQIEDLSNERCPETSLVGEDTYDPGHLDVWKTMESVKEPSYLPIEVMDFCHICSEAGDQGRDDSQSLFVRPVVEVLGAREKPEIWQFERRSQSIAEQDQSHNQEQQSTVMSMRNTESSTFLHGILEEKAIAEEETHEASLKEKKMKIKAKGVNELGLLADIKKIMKIVGYTGDPHTSIMEQIRALYMFLGVEPLSNHTEMDESEMANAEVELLKTVVGVK